MKKLNKIYSNTEKTYWKKIKENKINRRQKLEKCKATVTLVDFKNKIILDIIPS